MFTNADACGVYTDEFIWARDYDIDLKVTYAINNYMVNPQHARSVHSATRSRSA